MNFLDWPDMVLPAHGTPFHCLHARLDRLAHGHDRGGCAEDWRPTIQSAQ